MSNEDLQIKRQAKSCSLSNRQTELENPPPVHSNFGSSLLQTLFPSTLTLLPHPARDFLIPSLFLSHITSFLHFLKAGCCYWSLFLGTCSVVVGLVYCPTLVGLLVLVDIPCICCGETVASEGISC